MRIYFADTIVDAADNQVYKYVVLGKRAWFAQNLRRQPKWGFANQDSNGINYEWAQAMDLDSAKCQNNNCSVGLNPMGLCPEGWNIPDSTEWAMQVRWVAHGDGDSAAVQRMKSRTGWTWDTPQGFTY